MLGISKFFKGNTTEKLREVKKGLEDLSLEIETTKRIALERQEIVKKEAEEKIKKIDKLINEFKIVLIEHRAYSRELDIPMDELRNNLKDLI